MSAHIIEDHLFAYYRKSLMALNDQTFKFLSFKRSLKVATQSWESL